MFDFNKEVQKKGKNHGYSNINKILYVVYYHKRSFTFNLDYNADPGTNFSLPNTEQMVSNAPRNF